MFNIYVYTAPFSGGTTFDYIDLFCNISTIADVDFKLFVEAYYVCDFISYIKNSYNSNFINRILKHMCIIKDPNEISSIILNSNNFNIAFIHFSILQRYLDKQIIERYKKIYIISSWRMIRNFLYDDDVFPSYNYDNIKILASPFFKKFLIQKNIPLTKYQLHYSKLSSYRLDNIKLGYDGVFSDYENYSICRHTNKNFNIHNFGKLFYTRRSDALYLESKAKTLFEFLYFNKPVYYSSKNKVMDDGLTDYLKLFNVDDNISQELYIPSSEVYEKLIKFDESDLNNILNS